MTTLPLRAPTAPQPVALGRVLSVISTVFDVLAEADQHAAAVQKRLSVRGC